jgi:signal peptidase I
MLRIIRVSGFSLLPDYDHGDFVVTSKIPVLLKRLRPGDVIVFNQPGYGRLIKRIERVRPERGEVFVVGSHSSSVDSRQFGAVRLSDVTGKVILHVRRGKTSPPPIS